MEFRFEVDNTPEEVFRYLSDMPSFVSVHPLIYRIDALDNDNYLIHEKLKFGPLSYNFTYPLVIQTDAEKREIKMFAVIKKFIFVSMDFVIQTADGKTIVKEAVSVKSVLPVIPVMKMVFAHYHKQLFANMA